MRYMAFSSKTTFFLMNFRKSLLRFIHSHDRDSIYKIKVNRQFIRKVYEKKKKKQRMIDTHRQDEGKSLFLRRPSEIDPLAQNPDLLARKIGIMLYNVPSWEAARHEFEWNYPVSWSPLLVCRVLRTHPPPDVALCFFNWVASRPHFWHNSRTYTSMIDLLGKAGRIEDMKSLLQHMGVPELRMTSFTYTTVMHRLARAGDIDGAIQAWKSMRLDNIRPTLVGYTLYMRILLGSNRVKEASEIYNEMISRHYKPNCHTYNVLMAYLAKEGKFNRVFKLLEEMKIRKIQPDVVTFHVLVKNCAILGKTDLLNRFLLLMRSHNLKLRTPVFFKALTALDEAGESSDLLRELHPHICEMVNRRENPLSLDEYILLLDSDIVRYLLRRNNFSALEVILEEMLSLGIKLDVAIVANAIHKSSVKGKLRCAMVAYRYCKGLEIQLDRNVYSGLLGILMKNQSFDSAMEVVNEMMQGGVSPGPYLVSVILKALGCAGLSDKAEKLFEALPLEQNVVTYTGLIDAFFNSASIGKAIKLYKKMKKCGVMPARGTYTVLQLGLERASRFEAAKKFRYKRLYIRPDPIPRNEVEKTQALQKNLCDLLFDNNSHLFGINKSALTITSVQ